MEVASVPEIPSWLPELLADDGVTELYPPQAAAVDAGVTAGESVVASVPTASGKTLVATLAMLSSIERGGKALYIVPLRALASEKHEEFEQFEAYGLSIGVSTGNYESSGAGLADADVIVATSEKVDSLLRNDAPWMDELSCVVTDEVHLVDDDHRGPTLEVTLARLKGLAADPQIVALSATVGNAGEVATWLDAALVESDWRPIELRAGVHYGQAAHFDDGSTEELPVTSGEKPTEAIVRDTLDDGGSTLVFVNSRRNAKGAGKRLAGVVGEQLSPDERNELAAIAAEIRSVSDTQTNEELANAVEHGGAFHHAGLSRRTRSLIEDAFRDRLLKVVVATPTLAAGVNTPSRRVVVRDWRRYDGSVGGMAPLSVLEVHQMFGRAGRPGRDPYGEALLLANSHDELDELFEQYVWASPEPVESKLAAEPALRTHVLSTVASGVARTRDGLLAFLKETLYATQTENAAHLESVMDDCVAYLDANEFLTFDRSDGSLAATSLGHTVSRLYLDPMSAAEIVDGLRGASEPTPLGLYHLVARTPDMYELYLRSGDREAYTMTAYERETEFLGAMPSEFEDARFEEWLSALKTARLLEDWASERDEDRITDDYGVGPGDIRGKVDTAEWLLRGAEQLAVELDLSVGPAIRRARKRVEYGVSEELIDLAGVHNVGRKRARRLYDAGITTRADLRSAAKATVLGAVRGRTKTAEGILEAVGHPDPSMDGITAPDATTSESSPTADGQSTLGDFP